MAWPSNFSASAQIVKRLRAEAFGAARGAAKSSGTWRSGSGRLNAVGRDTPLEREEVLNDDPRLDVVGDIHGHADALQRLIHELGYEVFEDVFRHPER